MRDVVDFCYPGLCLACREVCPPSAELCDPCAKQIDSLARTPSCFFCGLTLPYDNAPCANCLGRGMPHYQRVIRLAKFDSPIQTLIHQLKYHRAFGVGEMLAERLLAQDHVMSLLQEADCLQPVPLHGLAYFARGYNQSEVIARRLSRETGLPVINAVSRTRNTHSQTHLHTRAQRMANLKDAFLLHDPGQIEGRRVIVIDDVKTTGATLRTLGRALRPGKPRSLSALVVAVAEQKGAPPK
jgi:ComF family protein